MLTSCFVILWSIFEFDKLQVCEILFDWTLVKEGERSKETFSMLDLLNPLAQSMWKLFFFHLGIFKAYKDKENLMKYFILLTNIDI